MAEAYDWQDYIDKDGELALLKSLGRLMRRMYQQLYIRIIILETLLPGTRKFSLSLHAPLYWSGMLGY